MTLTSDQFADYDLDGYLVMQNAVNDELLGDLVAAADQRRLLLQGYAAADAWPLMAQHQPSDWPDWDERILRSDPTAATDGRVTFRRRAGVAVAGRRSH